MAVVPGEFTKNPISSGRPRKGNRVPAGAFPAAPIEGDIFWRTDLNQLYVWDGANWRQITII